MFATHSVADRAALERGMAELKPAVLLLDLALPRLVKRGGVSAIQRLNAATKIVLLTHAPNEKEGLAMLMAGARGYSDTNIDPALLKRTMVMVQKGEIWVGRQVIHRLLDELSALTKLLKKKSPAKPDPRLDSLTPREREIVRLISGGASNKEIAGQLHVSEKTVKAHLTEVFRKLNLSDRLHLALFANR